MFRESLLRNLIWLLSVPFFFAAWVCKNCNFLNVRDDLLICHSILKRYADQTISNELYDVLRLAEDHRNGLHFGIDPIAICRAVWRNITRAGFEGASTIEQQFVRSCTGQNERTFERKFKEQMVAVMLRHFATKRQISVAFVLTAHFGDLHRGPLKILRELGSRPSNATQFDAVHLVARIKFPEPYPNTDSWLNRFETRVRFLSRLSANFTHTQPNRQKRPFQLLYLSNY